MIWHKIVISDASTSGSGGLGAQVGAALGVGLPMTLSNNVYSLGLVLDADVVATHSEGTTAGQFRITAYDLADADYTRLQAAHSSGGLAVTISLGYFDNPGQLLGDQPVMRGRVMSISRPEDAERPRIILSGLEETAYLLTRSNVSVALRGRADLDTVVRNLLQDAESAHTVTIRLAAGSTLGSGAQDYTIVGGTHLSALTQLAELTDRPILIGDGSVALGPAVGTALAPVELNPTTNLVKRRTSSGERSSPAQNDASGPVDVSGSGGREITGWHELTVLGHPQLRAGQMVRLAGVEPMPDGPLRISRVIHRYSTSAGYTCDVSLTDAQPGTRARPAVGVAAVVDRWNQRILAAREENPSIDIGEATRYRAGSAGGDDPVHRVTMSYRQVPQRGSTSLSTDSPVGTTDELLNKPIASAFAFDKVGLVTPVYPGMRAVLVHNRSVANDAIVAGWLWPKEPASSPPPNQNGDHWLALPTEIGGDGRPTGKGVHDLTDARGCRVVHARALHIVVGTGSLAGVGTRPEPPQDDTVTIEHSSGTTISIASDGALSIATQQKAITLGNGAVSIELDGTQVKVS